MDFIGSQFGKWEVIAGPEIRTSYNKYWLCTCACGTTKWVKSGHLKAGKTKSCGCAMPMLLSITRKRLPDLITNKSGIYQSFINMHQRCKNPKNNRYKHYGGRGISVCDRWGDFLNFYEDMGDKPFNGAQIDRINNNLGYSPDNCRWASRTQNARNTSNVILITLRNVTRPLTEWCELTGVASKTARARIYRGWDHIKAITAQAYGKNHAFEWMEAQDNG